MIDFYPLEAEAAIQRVLKLDWNTLIPGHPGVGGRYGMRIQLIDATDCRYRSAGVS
jgi:hypothetical protein